MRGNRLELERTQAGWLYLRRQGVSARDIAAEAGSKLRTVQLGIQEARLREGGSPTQNPSPRVPHLEPLYPITPLVPASPCPHHGPIRAGSVFCCMVCHQSGQDAHPALRRDPRTDPKPDRKPSPARHHERRRTRKERRELMARLNPARCA